MTETTPTGQSAEAAQEHVRCYCVEKPGDEICPVHTPEWYPDTAGEAVAPDAPTSPLAAEPAPVGGTGATGPSGAAEGAETPTVSYEELEAAYRRAGTERGGLGNVARLVADRCRADLERLREELARLEAEGVDRMADRFVEEARIRSLEIRNGSVNLDMEPARELVAVWVGAARTMLGDAPNYTETVVEVPTDDDPTVSMEVKLAGVFQRYAFTLQRVGKLTPHQARMRAEVERAAERKRADKAVALVDDLLDELVPRGAEPPETLIPCYRRLAELRTTAAAAESNE